MKETYAISLETRLPRAEVQRVDAAMSAIARHYNFAKHTLIALRNRGEKLSKPDAMVRFGLSGRQYNAVKQEVDGLFQSQASNMARYIGEAQQKIDLAQRRADEARTEIALLNSEGIPVGDQRYNRWYATLRGSDRRIQKQQAAIGRWQALLDAKRIRYCEGSRRLFHRQFHPEANGYRSHADWLTDYRAARDREFFVLGSKDETMGNQSCVISPHYNGCYSLRLRVPTGLEAELGTHITLNDIEFKYRAADIEQAFLENQLRQQAKQKNRWQGESYLQQHQDQLKAMASEQAEAVARWQQQGVEPTVLNLRQEAQAKRLAKCSKPTVNNVLSHLGQALSYRFLRDRKGWRVIVSISREASVQYLTDPSLGAIGIDLNEHHLAVTEIDSRGNKVNSHDIVFRPTGYDAGARQVRTWLEEGVKVIVRRAAVTGKPVVVEKLSFKAKKAALPTTGSARHNQTVSSLITARFQRTLKLRCFEAGVERIPVSAAYTSLIGRLKYSREFSGDVHQAAAMVIARRGLGFTDRHLPAVVYLTVRGRPTAFAPPADGAKGDPWAYWRNVSAAYRQWHQSTWQAVRDGYLPVASPPACSDPF